MINAQKELLKAGGSVLALAGLISKFRAKFNEDGNTKAKKSYSETATVKKQNSELAKKQIEAIEQKEIAKEAPKAFGIDSIITATNDEQKIAEEKATVKGFGEIIRAESSETKIPANDPDVQGLIELKQKNLKRAAAASKAQKAYQASKGYEEDFPIRDYLPDVEDKELKKAGITKTELNKLSSILAGNGTDEDIQHWFKKHNASDMPVINMDSLTVSEDTARAIKTLILDKDKYIKEDKQELQVDDWYTNFDRNNNKMSDNYKVWQDEPKEEEIKTDRNFSGFVF